MNSKNVIEVLLKFILLLLVAGEALSYSNPHLVTTGQGRQRNQPQRASGFQARLASRPQSVSSTWKEISCFRRSGMCTEVSSRPAYAFVVKAASKTAGLFRNPTQPLRSNSRARAGSEEAQPRSWQQNDAYCVGQVTGSSFNGLSACLSSFLFRTSNKPLRCC